MRFFVYGTLMHDFANSALFDGRARMVAPATTTGELRSVGGFPALLPGDGTVHGEVWEAISDDVLAELTAALDMLEGVDHEFPAMGMYRRELCMTSEGVAWTYLWNGPAERLPLVPSGCWRQWRNERDAARRARA